MVVKDLMVPLSEYATVPENATLYEAVSALEKAQKEFDKTRYQHRAVLIYNKDGKIIGKLSQLDVLKALEPKYQNMVQPGAVRLGFSYSFIKSIMDQYQLFQDPLENICKIAGSRKVTDFMYTPSEGEYVDEAASISQAIHQVIMGHHQSLLVTGKEKDDIVGILRVTDIFKYVTQLMHECKLTKD